MSADRNWWRSPLPWLSGLLIVYLLSPIGDFLGRLVTTQRSATPGTGAALAVSAETATIATVVVAIVGVPLAYLLARGRSRTSAAVGVAVQLPIALPPLISGIMLLYLVGPYGVIGRLFGGRLTDDRAGIVLAQIFVSAPFLVVAARSAFAAIDPAFDDVAATLGHRPWSRFIRVAVPTAIPGIVAGLMLAWLRGFGEFGATVVLAYHPYSLPVFSYVQFGSTGLPATIMPTAAALGTAIVVLLVAAALGRTRARMPIPRMRVANHAPTTLRGASPVPLSFDLATTAGAFVAHSAGSTARCLAIIGATGAGKTLTLRTLAGLHRTSSGSAVLGDRDLAALPVERRKVGYLPQESGLLPHLRVRDQVRFAVGADPAQAELWVARLDLTALTHRWPDQLSGGQRRRVALARALAADPDVLLLDEPFTGLDTPSRHELRRTLRALLADTPITTVLVTHDPEDVAMLADDVTVLDQGRTLQQGTREQVYLAPAGAHVARLLGIANALEATVVGLDAVQTADGVRVPATAAQYEAGANVLAIVDPWAIAVSEESSCRGRVVDVVEFADHRRTEVQLGAETSLVLHTASGPGLERDAEVGLDIPMRAVRLSSNG